ncbi:MAG: hypothetical protein JOY96_03565 [Verrucomicrobia bacterium]|nr:hypothetical protein [Verrucomicrobiota bacterium]
MKTELFQQVVSVQVVSPRGEFATLTPDQIDIEYRNVPALRHCFAVEGTFRGRPDSRNSIDNLLAQSAAIRKSTQPIAASAGCIFKNPKECSAGRLIEELGLKGRTVGAARVSQIHGNFIVNDGGARASHVLRLIQEIQTIARERRGIELHLEVQIVGDDNE